MKRFLEQVVIQLVLVLVSCNAVLAITEVTENIVSGSADSLKHWQVAYHPYYIEPEVGTAIMITEGQTVTIDPGVIVYMNGKN